MKLYIDGHNTHVEMSRHGSMWYKHPVRGTLCMHIKRDFALGYQTKQGRISRSNEVQKQFLQELHTEMLSVRVTYKDAGFLHHSNNVLASFTFKFEEKDSSWGEQRLQELLDKVLTLQAKRG